MSPRLSPFITAGFALALSGMVLACDAPADDGTVATPADEVRVEEPTAVEPGEALPAEDIEVESAPDVIATVNGEPLAMADFQRQAFDTQRYFVERGLDPNTEEGRQELMSLRRQVLLDMINQVLIEQAATELGIDVAIEEAEAIVAAHEEELGGADAFDASLQAAGTTREDVLEMERTSLMGQRFVESLTADVPTEAEFIHARHILCADAESCETALQRLEAGEDFETVAAEVSTDEVTAERGGDLDWIPRIEGATYLPSAEMEAALRDLGAGERSGVVSSEFGFHILEVSEVDPSRALTDDQRFQLVDKSVQDWLSAERAAADIVIYLEDLRDIVGG